MISSPWRPGIALATQVLEFCKVLDLFYKVLESKAAESPRRRKVQGGYGAPLGPVGPKRALGGPKNMFYIFGEGLGASWDLWEHFWDVWARANF